MSGHEVRSQKAAGGWQSGCPTYSGGPRQHSVTLYRLDKMVMYENGVSLFNGTCLKLDIRTIVFLTRAIQHAAEEHADIQHCFSRCHRNGQLEMTESVSGYRVVS
jgi:hypothetical protein